MSPRLRLIAVSLAGLLAMSLSPAAIGQERLSAVAASLGSATSGLVSPASALTFTNRTTVNGLGSNYVYAVYATDDTIYAATLNLGGTATGGLSISTDGGASFTNRLSGTSVIAVFATDDTIYAGTDSGGLSISTDGGITFDNRTVANSGLVGNAVYGVHANGSKVYAATDNGLSISTDGGANFTTALSLMRVWSVYAIDDTIYAGTDYQGLRISSDGGATFANRTIAEGLGADNVRGVYAAGSTVYAATANNFIGVPGTGGVSVSTDGGATFTNDDTTSGLGDDNVYSVYESGGAIYAATRGGVSVSSDGGATYTNYSTSNSAIGSNEVIGVFARGGIVYAATDSGLSISGPSLPALDASPSSSSIAPGAAVTVTISSAALAIPDGTSVSAVSAAPGVATVTSTASSSGGSASFIVTGVSAGTSNVTFSATGYANIVVPVTVTTPTPGPAPGLTPSEPLAVSGVAGDGSGVLSWAKPSSAGSFPVTSYQAVVSPGGQSCLVSAPALTCTITGLSNGTTYTASARALNGAGWGPYSDASMAFTPAQPSMLITGTRGEVRGRPGIIVSGRAQGLAPDAVVHPWFKFPGQTIYRKGISLIRVDESGEFTWQRRTGKKIYISIRSADGEVRSNRLIMQRR